MNEEKNLVRKAVIKLAWPVMLQNLLMSMMFLSDTIMLGRYENASLALAAVGLSGPVNMLIRMTLMSVAIAATAMVARSFGEKNEAKTQANAATALTVGVILGGIISLMGAFFARHIIAFFTDPASTLYEQAVTYLSITLSAFVMNYLYMIGTAVLRGAGDTKTALKITIFANIMNIIWDYILIYGKLGFPAMGVKGAAIATFGCSILEGALILAYMFFSRKSPVQLSIKVFGLVSWQALKTLRQISMPAAFEPIITHAGNLLFIKIVAGLGQAALATHHVIMRIESLSFMPGMGLSVATAALVGQYLGARKPELAHLTSRQSIKFAWIVMGFLGALFFCFPSFIIGIFTQEKEVITLGIYCLMIAALEQPIMGYAMIHLGTFRGAGDTTTPLYINIVGVWMVRLPLAFLFVDVFGFGLNGIWLTMPIDWLVRSIIYKIYYKKGKWRKIIV